MTITIAKGNWDQDHNTYGLPDADSAAQMLRAKGFVVEVMDWDAGPGGHVTSDSEAERSALESLWPSAFPGQQKNEINWDDMK